MNFNQLTTRLSAFLNLQASIHIRKSAHIIPYTMCFHHFHLLPRANLNSVSTSPITLLPGVTSTIFSESVHPSIDSDKTSIGSIQPTHTPTTSTGGDDSSSMHSRYSIWPWVVVALVLVLVPACVLSTLLPWVWYRRRKQRNLHKSQEQAPSGIRNSLLQTSGSHESTVSIHLREKRVHVYDYLWAAIHSCIYTYNITLSHFSRQHTSSNNYSLQRAAVTAHSNPLITSIGNNVG